MKIQADLPLSLPPKKKGKRVLRKKGKGERGRDIKKLSRLSNLFFSAIYRPSLTYGGGGRGSTPYKRFKEGEI